MKPIEILYPDQRRPSKAYIVKEALLVIDMLNDFVEENIVKGA